MLTGMGKDGAVAMRDAHRRALADAKRAEFVLLTRRGGKWLPALPAAGAQTRDLTTSPTGTAHTFLWDVYAPDVAYEGPWDDRSVRAWVMTLIAGDAPVGAADLPARLRQGRAAQDSLDSAGETDLPLPPPTDSTALDGAAARLPAAGINLKDYLEGLERTYICQALAEANDVVAHAAELLNMRRTTLVEKMRKYGLQRAGTASDL